MERRSGVMCADLIDDRVGGCRAIYNICVYSLKRLACVTFVSVCILGLTLVAVVVVEIWGEISPLRGI